MISPAFLIVVTLVQTVWIDNNPGGGSIDSMGPSLGSVILIYVGVEREPIRFDHTVHVRTSPRRFERDNYLEHLYRVNTSQRRQLVLGNDRNEK